jgi:carbamoyl-phosphate synthase large subunit
MADTSKKVLITSAGRRVQLVRCFQNAMAKRLPEGRVLVGESDPTWSAAARVADGSFELPRVTDAGYGLALHELVRRERIALVVPTIDTELLILSRMRGSLADLGCTVTVCDEALVTICRDKRESDGWFRSLGFETPRIMDRDAVTFPCFVKPYNGSLSRGARALLSSDSLSRDMTNDPTLMFMELLDSAEYDEYTIDAYYTRTGALRCLVPRQRVEVRGGEISKGVARKGALYEFLQDRLQQIPGARGCLTFQFFASRLGNRRIAIELNPRFGGGYPLSYAAGADYPDWLIREYLLGEELPAFDAWKDRTAMVRYDAEVIFTLPGST